MGNTSAEWFLFAAAPFRERFQEHPRELSAADWRELVQAGDAARVEREVATVPAGERERLRGELLASRERRLAPLLARTNDEPVSLEDPDGAAAVLDACQAACGRGFAAAWDVLHAMHDGQPWDLYPVLDDAGEDEMCVAWERLAEALGKDGPPDGLPWWIGASHDPDGWFVGLVSPGQAVKLTSALDQSGLRERAAELLAERDPQAAAHWARLLELLDRAGADDCFLLALESMG